MGTEKRERQKANRQRRQIEEARAYRIGTVKRNVVRWTTVAVLAVGAVVFIAWLGGAFEGDEVAAPGTTLPLTDAPPTTLAELPAETPDKPEVEIPAEVPAELVVTDLVRGEGDPAVAGDTVTVHYVGVLSEDGTEFDNSYDRGSPFPVVLGQGSVIQGWDEGLIGVRAGGRRQLDIPAEMAYGDSPPPGGVIEAGDALTFVVDVLSVTAVADR